MSNDKIFNIISVSVTVLLIVFVITASIYMIMNCTESISAFIENFKERKKDIEYEKRVVEEKRDKALKIYKSLDDLESQIIKDAANNVDNKELYLLLRERVNKIRELKLKVKELE